MPLEPAAAIGKIAEDYTRAWCSRSTEAMGAYFADVPDLVLRMDDLRSGGDQAIFLWTLEGTNSGPGGTGNFVRIAGWQTWRLDEDGLIIAADGGYDAEDYERQIRGGR